MLDLAIREQQYYMHAGAIGVSRDVARANLQAVVREYQQSLAYFDVFEVAWQRLIETPITRPSERVRDAVRHILLGVGYLPTPDVIDSYARTLSTRTDADDFAELQVPDSLAENSDG